MSEVAVKMKFKPWFRQAIEAGAKTRTRRPLDNQEAPRHAKNGVYVDAKWCWQNGWDGSLIGLVEDAPKVFIGDKFLAVCGETGEAWCDCTCIDVRLERLQDISVTEVFSEGLHQESDPSGVQWYGPHADYESLSTNPFKAFKAGWNLCYGEHAHTANPWVWVYEFAAASPTTEKQEP